MILIRLIAAGLMPKDSSLLDRCWKCFFC